MDQVSATTLTGPLPGGHGGATVTLRPLLTGEMRAPEAFLHREPGPLSKLHAIGLGTTKQRPVWLPIPVFLIEHPTAGRVLIDTGIAPAAVHDPVAAYGHLGARLYNVRVTGEQPVPARLKQLGIELASIKTVVMTHLHIDHTGAVGDLPHATFVVSAPEWRAAQHQGVLKGYRKRSFSHAFDYRLVDYEAKSINSFASFGRSFDLFDDGSITLVSTPGHSAGHQSVVLRLAHREALICGDAAYTKRTLEHGQLPAFLDDEHNFQRSLREIRTYTQMTPSALVIPGHDPEAWSRLDGLYE